MNCLPENSGMMLIHPKPYQVFIHSSHNKHLAELQIPVFKQVVHSIFVIICLSG